MTKEYKQGSFFNVSPCYTSEAFSVCESNQMAFTWINNSSPQSGVILGPEGSGKTHMAHIWARRHKAVFFTPCNDPLDALHHRAIVCDNADKITEKNLLIIYNTLFEKQGFLLLTMRSVPSYTLPDWSSRFNVLPRLTIYTPTEKHIHELFIKALNECSIDCPAHVQSYIMERIPYSYSALYTFVNTLLQDLPDRKALTIACIKKILESI